MTNAVNPLRIAVVAPIMVRYDAISLAVRDTVRCFSRDFRFSVKYFGCACNFPEIPHRICPDIADLLLDPDYCAADVAIYHFGIYHNLFQALLAGGPRIRIVRFHNVTPSQFVALQDRPIIERSLQQIELFRRADEIWADSPTNARELLERGFDVRQLRVIPLVVEDPAPLSFADKPKGVVNVLFIGRFAPSKGLHDLIAAIGRGRLLRETIRVTLVGNTTWSDPAYVARVRDLIAFHNLNEIVHLAGMVSDAERERLLHDAHILAIPSYHEGFCRPVVEGLRAGCIPIGYDAYNLPCISAELGRMVPVGDIAALAEAMEHLVSAVPTALSKPDDPLLPLDRGATSANDFTIQAKRHGGSFEFASVTRVMQRRVLRLTSEIKAQKTTET